MQNQLENEKISIFSPSYWREAASNTKSTKMLVYAALIIALRVVVKGFKIPAIQGVSIAFDCYVNSLGSIVYGPIMGLLVGAVSDSIGCILFPNPTAPYFFPFIIVEMSSSFIFALFFWKRNITPLRAISAKFTVSFVCNIILTSLLVKWQYALLGMDKVYYLITGVRVVKNLVLFPLEAMLILLILSAAMPILKASGLVKHNYIDIDFSNKRSVVKLIVTTAVFLLLAIVIILFYFLFLKDFVSEHNFKFFG